MAIGIAPMLRLLLYLFGGGRGASCSCCPWPCDVIRTTSTPAAPAAAGGGCRIAPSRWGARDGAVLPAVTAVTTVDAGMIASDPCAVVVSSMRSKSGIEWCGGLRTRLIPKEEEAGRADGAHDDGTAAEPNARTCGCAQIRQAAGMDHRPTASSSSSQRGRDCLAAGILRRVRRWAARQSAATSCSATRKPCVRPRPRLLDNSG